MNSIDFTNTSIRLNNQNKETHKTNNKTYRTPTDDGLSGQAKNLIAGKYRDNPAFHVMVIAYYILYW